VFRVSLPTASRNSDADVRVMEPSLAPRGVFDGRPQGDQWKSAPYTGFRNMETVCFSRKRGEGMAGLGRCVWRQKSASRFRTGLRRGERAFRCH